MKKYKLTINLGLKITAFVFSVFLWLIVVNIDNPVSSITYNNIPVTIVNDDIITSSGRSVSGSRGADGKRLWYMLTVRYSRS